MVKNSWSIIIKKENAGNFLVDTLYSIVMQEYDHSLINVLIIDENEEENIKSKFGKYFSINYLKDVKELNNFLSTNDSEFLSIINDKTILYPEYSDHLIKALQEDESANAAIGGVKISYVAQKSDYVYTARKDQFFMPPFDKFHVIFDNLVKLRFFVFRSDLIKSIQFDQHDNHLNEKEILVKLITKDINIKNIEQNVIELVKEEDDDLYFENKIEESNIQNYLENLNSLNLTNSEIVSLRRRYETLRQGYDQLQKIKNNDAYRILEKTKKVKFIYRPISLFGKSLLNTARKLNSFRK